MFSEGNQSGVEVTIALLQTLEREQGIWTGVQLRNDNSLEHFAIELWPEALDNGGALAEAYRNPDGPHLVLQACAKLGRIRAGSDWYPKPHSRSRPSHA